jgi:UDP-N-acetylglucosamine 2-epimerase (non-hydrolysing)
MKVAPVFAELERRGEIEQVLVHTGQHYDALLSDVFFAELPLPEPQHTLNVGSGTHGYQTAAALEGLERIFADLTPDLVLVAGDVNSTLAGALAAVKLGMPVCHLEAGLRSFDWSMPEEHNRRLTDHVSMLLLTHSESADKNLHAEGIKAERIRLVGNTMIDTLLANVDAARSADPWLELGLEPRGFLLVTLHRPALVDDIALLAPTMRALDEIAAELPVVFPVHPRTRARLADNDIAVERVVLLDPLPYRTFLGLEAEAAAVLTDSGGVQEEATALGVRCFTMRDNTERPVTVTEGTNELIGLAPERLAQIPARLAEPRESRVPALWDGHAGERAADAIDEFLRRAR